MTLQEVKKDGQRCAFTWLPHKLRTTRLERRASWGGRTFRSFRDRFSFSNSWSSHSSSGTSYRIKHGGARRLVWKSSSKSKCPICSWRTNWSLTDYSSRTSSPPSSWRFYSCSTFSPRRARLRMLYPNCLAVSLRILSADVRLSSKPKLLLCSSFTSSRHTTPPISSSDKDSLQNPDSSQTIRVFHQWQTSEVPCGLSAVTPWFIYPDFLFLVFLYVPVEPCSVQMFYVLVEVFSI